MITEVACILLIGVFHSTRAVGFHGFTYKGLEEPEVSDERANLVTEKWIEQPVDHFNVRDNRTWSMRYYENDEFSNGSGPILIMLGGEWKIATGFVQSGLMYDIAEKHGAIMYYTEHRYYGNSQPVNDTESENLQYLSVDQALADVAYFVDAKKNENSGFVNSSVIVFGGSYGGNMAAWTRMKYPHLIQGAVASSAPVRAKPDFFEYYEVVANSLARSSKKCVEDLENAFDNVEQLLDSPNGPETLKKYFNLCQVPNTSSPSDVGNFMNGLAEKFASVVQYNKIFDDGSSSISKICESMIDKTVGTPIMRLAKLFAGEKCLDSSYESLIAMFKNTSWNLQEETNFMRLWFYQTCSEVGYYQTTSSNKSVFGSLVPLEFYVRMCSDLYGERYDGKLLVSKVRRTNIMYGGSVPDTTNVVFTNGNVDPWHALSVLEDLNEKSPAILIDGSSHCQDLYPDSKTDVAGVLEARKRVRAIVANWLTTK